MPVVPRLLDHIDDVLQQCPLEALALLTDIDGTISPIAPTPQAAQVDPACRAALRALATCLPLVACLSGRPAAAAAQLVGLPGLAYAGSHGLDYLVDGQPQLLPEAASYVADVEELGRRVAAALPAYALLERKPVSLALHYRAAADEAAAQRELRALLDAAMQGLRLRVRPGRRVLEAVPDLPVHKGVAAERLLQGRPCRGVLYLGDDVTDAEAFAALGAWATRTGHPTFRVAVVSDEAPPDLLRYADYQVAGVPEVAAALSALARRCPPAGRGAGPAAAPPPST